MAQQTQVQRAAEVYPEFMRRFPTIAALAAADSDDVVRAFSGLGYYRRARLLHTASQAIVALGAWPVGATELARLPGVGPYTAAAVAAFAFAGAEPPVDGNVSRVTARVRALSLPLGSAALLRAGREWAGELYEQARTPEVWEAVMELGATVCAPSSPLCGACPLRRVCAAAAAGSADTFPPPRPRRDRERQLWATVWLEGPGRSVLLRRVENGTLLRGLWLPPFAALAPGEDPAACARSLAREAGWSGTLAQAHPVRHSITHRSITILPFVGAGEIGRVSEGSAAWSWQDPDHPAVPSSTLLGKLAATCRGWNAVSFAIDPEEE